MRKEGDTAKQMRADLLGAATGRGAAWAGRLGRQVSAAAQIAATQLGRALRNRTGPGADYRDRISVATWLVVLGLGASLVIDLPTAVVSFWAFGSPITLPFTGAIWFAIFLALTAATGAQSVVARIRLMPTISVLGAENWPYWALPMALTSIAVLLLPLGPSPVINLAAIALAGR